MSDLPALGLRARSDDHSGALLAPDDGRTARTPPTTLKGHVVVVDDDPDLGDVFADTLTKHGCTAEVVTSAAQALSLLATRPADALLTDLVLGGTSGLELCAAVRKRFPDLPVIVVTGHASLDLAVAAIRAGAYDFITKPVSSNALVIALHRALERGALRREVRDGIDHVRRSEKSFHALIEHSPDVVAVLRDGLFVYVNGALGRSLGLTDTSGLLGRPLADVLHPDDAPITAVTPTWSAPRQLRWRRADGTTLVTEAVAIEIDFDGERAIAMIAHDLSDLLLMQARLLESDRMASLGTLAAGAAHEINNPLTYVLLGADVLARDLRSLTAAVQGSGPFERAVVASHLATLTDAVSRVAEGSRRVRDIVANLKTFSRSEVDTRSRADVRHLLDSSIALVLHEIRPRARLTKRLDVVPPVHANDARLGQVFVNLLVNAVQAIPAGHPDENEIFVSSGVTPEGEVMVEVRDTGVGISPAVLGRIFDPFFTTKPVGVGTGLGLSICHGIVSALGGRITVDSEVGRGTTFRLFLPAENATFIQAPSDEPPPEKDGRKRRRAMVVDDEPSVGLAIGRALREALDVTVIDDPRQALELVRSGELYDVILCDVRMPVMTGVDLYRAIEAISPDQAGRMIFMTGGAFTAKAEERIVDVPAACIDKPIDLHRLRAEVERVAAEPLAPPQAKGASP